MSKLTLAFCSVLALLGPALAGGTPTLEQGQRYLRSGNWKKAAEAFSAITAEDPSSGAAWFNLAQAHNYLKNYDRSIEAGEKAAEFPEIRATSLYNVACSLSLKGDVDKALEALDRAMKAGFLDFDLLETDSDLDAVRRKQSFPMPRKHEYDVHKGNGKSFQYHVILPEGFDGKKTYPAAFAFPPGQGVRSADWMLESLFGGETKNRGWIVIVPVAPKDGWWTHPFHHAMEGLLNRLKRKYKVEGGRFHLVGFASGARPALTYSRMSGKYWQSLSTASTYGWTGWSEDDLVKFARRKIQVHLFVGAEDEYGVGVARRVHQSLKKHGGEASLSVLPEQDRQLLELHGGAWLTLLDQQRTTD